MSGAIAAGAASSAGAAAAAAAERRARMEEEEMTPYAADDLSGWEFKILRTAGKTFRVPGRFEAALEQEAEAGWELVEKFDDYRVRLKRRTECRERDRGLEFDPYRTWVGTTPGRMAARALAVAGVVILVIATVAFFVAR